MKLVCIYTSLWLQSFSIDRRVTELDALQFEEEEEGTSYLADLNAVPDFVDEAPVEAQAPSKEAVKTTA